MLARRLRLAAIAGVVQLSVIGCGADSAGPSSLPTATLAPTTSLPTESSSASPADTQNNQAVADSFVRTWWRTVDESGKAGDPTALDGLFDATCAFCMEIYDAIEGYAARGQKQENGERTVTSVELQATDTSSAVVYSTLDVAPGRIVASSGGVDDSFSGGTGLRYIFNVRFSESGWIVQDLIPLGPQ